MWELEISHFRELHPKYDKLQILLGDTPKTPRVPKLVYAKYQFWYTHTRNGIYQFW